MIHIPIEERYDKSRQMFHSGWFVAAGTLISVGSAAYSAYSSSEAAKKTGAAGAKMDKRMRQAQSRLVGQLGEIQAPQWNLGADIADAERITGYNQAQLERLYPGAKSQTELASMAINDMVQGRGPRGAVEETMRQTAELGGAGFNIATAGKSAVPGAVQQAQANFGRNIGAQADYFTTKGISMLQSMIGLSGAFIESPLQVGQSRLGFEKAAADIQMQKAQAEAGMAVDVAKGSYGTAVNTIGANLAANQAWAATGQALGSGISSYGMATSAARGAGTIDYKGQEYGNVKGFGGETYRPAVSESGGLYYKAQPSVSASASASKALTGGYG